MFPIRLQGIHVLHEPRILKILVAMFWPFLSNKIRNRVSFFPIVFLVANCQLFQTFICYLTKQPVIFFSCSFMAIATQHYTNRLILLAFRAITTAGSNRWKPCIFRMYSLKRSTRKYSTVSTSFYYFLFKKSFSL